MMAMDFVSVPCLRARMDENEEELLRLLYTRIGMIMENASITALDLGGPRSRFEEPKRQKLGKAVFAINALFKAANAVQD